MASDLNVADISADDLKSLGLKPPAVDGEGCLEAVPCEKPEDLYTVQARELIGRFGERLLNENVLTPTEVLHSPRHQNTLSNLPLFPSALQQAERAMGRRTGTLSALVNEAARIARQRTKEWSIPDLTPNSYAEAAAGVLSRDPGGTGRYIIDAALTQYIQVGRTFAEKAAMLLDLAVETEDADALVPIDRLLGEIVRLESGMASIAGELPFAALVEAIVTLVSEGTALPDDTPTLLRQMETLIRRVPMPALVDGLIVAFRRELLKPDRITNTSAGDLFGIESVQGEVMALGQIAERMRTGGGYLGGERTEASLQRRLSLLINEDTLPEIVKRRSFIEKLRILFMLQKMPLSPTSEKAVAGYLRGYFDGREFAGRLLDCWKDRADKLKGLGEVQRLILESPFPEDEREFLAQQVDEIQTVFIRTQRLLAPLSGKIDPSPDTVLEIVKLAADRAFCAGKSRVAVARVLYRQVHRPRFIRAFLLSAQGARDRAARVAWLKTALSHIGLPFIDLSALRVLVVDDEEGPRNYVESVLRELGIGSIETAVDGRDALDRFIGREDQVDLVICDWMMPRVSGLEVLRQMREARPDLPFLMVTALATRMAVEKALTHQVSGYIAKPFTPDQLEDKVLVVLTQKAAPPPAPAPA